MKRIHYRSMLLGGYIPRRPCCFNPCESVTDPSLAMTGTQLAVASMLGQPIPQPSVNYSFNSATSPDDVQEIDSVRADVFDVYSHLKSNKSSTDRLAKDLLSSPQYKAFKESLVKQKNKQTN